MASVPHAALADTVLVVHFAVIVFVVGGLLAIPVGHRFGWGWVNGWTFRLVHAAAVLVIVLQAWLGQHCPLTVLETWLRARAGQASPYEASFVQHWLERLIYFSAPMWVFALVYTAFAVLLGLVWWRYPPRTAARPGVPR